MTGTFVKPLGRLFRGLLLMAVISGLGACTTAELAIDMAKKYNKTQQEDKDAQQPAPVVAQPHYVGNPYQIAGIWYYLNDLRYDKTGIVHGMGINLPAS